MPVDDLAGAGLLAALLVLALALLFLRAEALAVRRRMAQEAETRRVWNRGLADASFDGLLVHRQGVILLMNRTLVRLLGVREREWLGQSFATLARPDHVAALRAELEAPGVQPVEFALLRANKSEVLVEVSSQVIEFEGQPATATALRDITERAADAARIARLTHYDALTDLPNRKLFTERLEAAVARAGQANGPVTLFTLDIDQFKGVNELLGRAGGDALLQMLAARIGGLVAPGDLLARLGSDKFALLLEGSAGSNRGLSLGGQVLAACQEPFIVEGHLVKLRLSIGLAMYPDHAPDAAALMQASEFALSQAEQAGGGAVHMYRHEEAGLHRQAARRMMQHAAPDAAGQLSGDLRAAIARGDIKPLFQPVFNLADLSLAGFEALPRWTHPSEGMLGPERFMPLADAAGLAPELSAQLIERACAEAANAGGVRMAINLCAAQFRDKHLPARLQAILRKTGLKPGCLEIELAEGVLVENRETAGAVLGALQALGIGIALDDFGTATSSLSSLCKLPLTRLKIDRRFVQKLGRDENAGALVKAVLTLGTNLRLPVTATGVESLAQLEFLRRHGCAAAQGRLLGEPTARAVARKPQIELAPPPRPALVVARD
jgi:diguanylate cyclase (GGDEF)-like protein/PAS domain S-box-containing protein